MSKRSSRSSAGPRRPRSCSGWCAIWVDAFPGIETNVEVCGGEPCIVRTRVPVWLLVQARRLGASEAQLLECYPSLRAEDLANAWAFERAHRDEIEEQIAENENA